jgi:RNA polymerase sigma-B factor
MLQLGDEPTIRRRPGPRVEGDPSAERSRSARRSSPPRRDHATIRAKFEELRRTNDTALRDELVEEHKWIASYCCRRFSGRGEPMADLAQVAQLGLLMAVARYDPSYDVHFATFAVPTILGELRRYFRDTTWLVHVPRRLKELHLQLAASIEVLRQDLGRTPRPDELAERLGATEDEVRVALEAYAAYRPASLTPLVDADGFDDDGVEEGSTLGEDDAAYDRVETAMVVRTLLSTLPARERRILELRFFEGRSQVEIGHDVGLSQIHVSRMLRSSLDRLHRELVAAGI